MDKSTGLRAEGWNREKIKEIVSLFGKLDYGQIGEILNSAKIRFADDYKKISKEEICWTIADDKTYEWMNGEIGKLREVVEGEMKELKRSNGV